MAALMTSSTLSDDVTLSSAASEHRQSRLLAHLESPSHWEADTQDYPSPDTVPFPKRMRITYAACHAGCVVRSRV